MTGVLVGRQHRVRIAFKDVIVKRRKEERVIDRIHEHSWLRDRGDPVVRRRCSQVIFTTGIAVQRHSDHLMIIHVGLCRRLFDLLGEVDIELLPEVRLQDVYILGNKLEHVLAHSAVVQSTERSREVLDAFPLLDRGLDHDGTGEHALVLVEPKHVRGDVGTHRAADRVGTLARRLAVLLVDVLNGLSSIVHRHGVVDLRSH